MDDIRLRSALPREATEITALARRSKAHWGYGREIMDRTWDMLRTTAAEVQHGRVVVAERDRELLGYYRIGGKPPDGELMDMFIEPDVIGTGVGRILWEHAVRSARQSGFHSMTLESDPHAEPFYLHMGAERIGEREVAPGRLLPLMRATLSA